MISTTTLKHILDSLASDEPTCLVCLTRSEALECINKSLDFQSVAFVNGKFSIAEMLCVVTHNTMSTMDFSQYICAQCLDLLTISFMFVKQCQATCQAIVQAILPLYSSVEQIDKGKAVTVMKISNVKPTATPSSVDYYESYSKVGKLFKFENKIMEADSYGNDRENVDEMVFKRESFKFKTEGLKKNECTVCDEHFSSKYELTYHIATHPPDSKHKCKECGKFFANATALRKHYTYLHVPDDDNDISLCPVCGKHFKKRALFNAHQVVHRDRKFKCKICDKLFQTNSNLAAHFNSIHSENRINYMCDICGMVVKTKFALQRHLIVHKLTTCLTCNVSFENKAMYNKHSCPGHKRKRRVRRQRSNVICDYCGYTGRNKTVLRVHIRDRHLKLLVFTCHICNKVCHRKSDYNRHISTHRQLKQEQCDVCGMQFFDKRALSYHLRLHTGEKPFECEFCGERFLSKCRRLTHVRHKHLFPISVLRISSEYLKIINRNMHVK